MLGFCLTPFPDELFYSWCSRIADFIGVANMSDILIELFGKPGHRVHVAFPSRIAHLVNQLPPQGQLSCDELIDQHTMFPLYRPFLVLEQAQALRDFMLDGKNSVQLAKAGLTRAIQYHPRVFRYCPDCVRADVREVGEPYWHRLHQVPGVLVCPNHAVYLESSAIASQCWPLSNELHTARRAILNTRACVINRTDPISSKLIRLAQDVCELLEQPPSFCGRYGLMRRYRVALLDACPGRYVRRIDPEKVRLKFVAFYSSELLASLGVDMGESGSPLPMQRMWGAARPVKQSLLHHLLLMQFLGFSPSKFFNLKEVSEPFGRGPWPCLNPACEYYRQNVIAEVGVTYVRRSYGICRGQFLCRCGFHYLRYQANKDREQYDAVFQYGTVWAAKLSALWKDPVLSTKRIAAVLGVSSTVVHWQVRALRLEGLRPVPRWIYKLNVSCPPQRSTRKRAVPLDLEKDREALTEFLEKCPGASRQDVCRSLSRSFYRLRYYDYSWWAAHLPLPHRRKASTFDWARRDEEVSKQVQSAIERIRKQQIAQRVGRRSIARELGNRYLIGCDLKRLPKTAALLRNQAQ